MRPAQARSPHWSYPAVEQDQTVSKEQCHTTKRIFERLQAEGYIGGYTQVNAKVRGLQQLRQGVHMSLAHRPGEAQMDMGQALVKQRGQLGKVFFFVMCLPYADALLVQTFPRACTETFWEFHRRAFALFAGVPLIIYDNDWVLIAKILGGHERALTGSRG